MVYGSVKTSVFLHGPRLFCPSKRHINLRNDINFIVVSIVSCEYTQYIRNELTSMHTL